MSDPAHNFGGKTDYWDVPPGAETLNDLIEHKNMSFAQGNIFKAAYRLGDKHHSNVERDLYKIIYYADRLIQQLRGKNNGRTTARSTQA